MGCGDCGEAELQHTIDMMIEEQDRKAEEWENFCKRTPSPIMIKAEREARENEANKG